MNFSCQLLQCWLIWKALCILNTYTNTEDFSQHLEGSFNVCYCCNQVLGYISKQEEVTIWYSHTDFCISFREKVHIYLSYTNFVCIWSASHIFNVQIFFFLIYKWIVRYMWILKYLLESIRLMWFMQELQYWCQHHTYCRNKHQSSSQPSEFSKLQEAEILLVCF